MVLQAFHSAMQLHTVKFSKEMFLTSNQILNFSPSSLLPPPTSLLLLLLLLLLKGDALEERRAGRETFLLLPTSLLPPPSSFFFSFFSSRETRGERDVRGGRPLAGRPSRRAYLSPGVPLRARISPHVPLPGRPSPRADLPPGVPAARHL